MKPVQAGSPVHSGAGLTPAYAVERRNTDDPQALAATELQDPEVMIRQNLEAQPQVVAMLPPTQGRAVAVGGIGGIGGVGVDSGPWRFYAPAIFSGVDDSPGCGLWWG